MKACIPASTLVLLLAISPVSGADPELERLTENYNAALAKAVAPIKGTYERELQKLLQKHTQTGNLNAASEVMAKLQELGTATSPAPAKPGETPIEDRLFVGKSWFSRAGSEYHFNKDGTGYRIQKTDYDGKVSFTWRKLPDGLVEVMQRKQPDAPVSPAHFRFVDRKTAFLGDRQDSVTSQIDPER